MVLIDIIAIALSVASTTIAGFSIYYSNLMHKQDLTHQNYEDIKNWYEKTLHIMKELYVEHAENFSKDNKKDLLKDLVNLSQQIDACRLYFPNIDTGDFPNKPKVFRGKRPIIMDLLVLYYDIFNLNKQKEEGNLEILNSIQRSFTSELVTYLKENKTSKSCASYTKYDKNGIINISNLDKEEFRNMLNKDDIIQEITKANKKVVNTKQQDINKKSDKISSIKSFYNSKKQKKTKHTNKDSEEKEL